MSARSFLDTNVVVYAFDLSSDDGAKRARAIEVLASEERLVVSTQVLLETYVTLTRKVVPPLPEDLARLVVGQLSRLQVVGADTATVAAAIDLALEHQLSLWDAMVVVAASSAGCDRLLTEDLAAGSTLLGVAIENPFADLG
jgi:predicted nucleic acid-binding protein